MSALLPLLESGVHAPTSLVAAQAGFVQVASLLASLRVARYVVETGPDGHAVLRVETPAGTRRVSFWAWHERQACWSWDLAPGPIELGGSCPASGDLAFREGTTCSTCVLPVNAGLEATGVGEGRLFSLVARLAYAQAQMRSGALRRKFVATMLWSIRALRPSVDGAHVRLRLHRTGDFFSLAYLDVWATIAKGLVAVDPRIVTLAPTRTWRVPGWLEGLQRAQREAPTLVLRPGNESRGEDLTHAGVPGLARPTVDSGQAEYTCPAYASAEGTCVSTGCTACWTRPELSITLNAGA